MTKKAVTTLPTSLSEAWTTNETKLAESGRRRARLVERRAVLSTHKKAQPRIYRCRSFGESYFSAPHAPPSPLVSIPFWLAGSPETRPCWHRRNEPLPFPHLQSSGVMQANAPENSKCNLSPHSTHLSITQTRLDETERERGLVGNCVSSLFALSTKFVWILSTVSFPFEFYILRFCLAV